MRLAQQRVGAALDHPHTAHRRMKVELDGYRGIASPIKLGRTPATYRTVPPGLNEPAQQVFGDEPGATPPR